MKFLPTHFLGFFILSSATAVGLRAATPVIGAQLFLDTNARIEDLFHYRDNPPPLPGPLDNPFRINDTPIPGTPAPGAKDGKPLVNVSHETPDELMLRQAYNNLSFGGLLQIGDRLMLVINKSSYKEGSLLIVQVQGSPVYLRVVSLSKDSVTLGLNEARLTLHF